MEGKHRTVWSLITKLSSVSEQTQAEALSELRLMTKLDADTRPLIADADAGTLPYLAETLYSSAKDDATATLLNLSISSRAILMSSRGLLDAPATMLYPLTSTMSSHL